MRIFLNFKSIKETPNCCPLISPWQGRTRAGFEIKKLAFLDKTIHQIPLEINRALLQRLSRYKNDRYYPMHIRNSFFRFDHHFLALVNFFVLHNILVQLS